MKVLFLDIDGVLNTSNTFQLRSQGGLLIPPCEDPLELPCLNELDRILDTVPDTKIVVSSSWRIIRKLDQLKEIFRKANFKNFEKIIDVTPILSERRGHEIQKWLNKNPLVEQYAIVDDDNDMLDSHQSRFIKTWFHHGGLTKDCADKIIDVLNGKELEIIKPNLNTKIGDHDYQSIGISLRQCTKCGMTIEGRGEPMISCFK